MRSLSIFFGCIFGIIGGIASLGMIISYHMLANPCQGPVAPITSVTINGFEFVAKDGGHE